MRKLLMLSLLFGGCALTPQQAATLTPDQISAYSNANEDVYACVYGGGPPGAGGLTVMVLPKSAKPQINFSPSCNIISGKIGGGQ